MSPIVLMLPVIVPAVAGALVLLFPKGKERACGLVAFLAAAVTFIAAIKFFGREAAYFAEWGGFGLNFSLKLHHYSSFTVLAASGFGILLMLYTVSFMAGRKAAPRFFAYFLFMLAFANGTALSDNIVLMLFFLEGMLVTQFGMIALGRDGSWKTAVKAVVLSGIGDLCMMLGVIMAVHIAGTAEMSAMKITAGAPLAVSAFVLAMIGATAKGGAMPLHTWIPDAALDAPLPFMAFVPAALEKLVGIYLLVRFTLDIFAIEASSPLSRVMMWLGSATIIFAVLMALVQKEFKRLLSFHAISQMGYMVLGIGTCVPAGVVGGIFHMFNNALYKSCLFLTGGAVERQAKTTDLARLGGLARRMPITFIGFAIAAVSISGVPPFNGFFSKELVYDGALSRGVVFYLAALVGSFLTAASFLKLGHCAFLGKRRIELDGVREAPVAMLVPIVVIAFLCILFGVYNSLPIGKFIEPILGARLGGQGFGGLHVSPRLALLSVGVLTAALAHHLWGARRWGSGLHAVDHIYHAPIARTLYNYAERGIFDIYNAVMKLMRVVSGIAWLFDRVVDFFYNIVAVYSAQGASWLVRRAHTGSHAVYVAWALIGFAIVVIVMAGGVM